MRFDIKIFIFNLHLILFLFVSVSCNRPVKRTITQSYLLKPTGPYLVGFQDYRFVEGTFIGGSYACHASDPFYNGTNQNDFGPDNQVDFCREMMVRVYYPIQTTQNLPYANYYEPAIRNFQAGISFVDPTVTASQLDALNNIQTFTINFTNQNSNIVNKTFPVLIFSPGSGVQVEQYENTITEMVSHGYIVLAINNTFIADVQFPYGLVPITSDLNTFKLDSAVLADILFTKQVLLDPNTNSFPEFINHMQLNHVGIAGHSISGIGIVQAVRDNPALFQAASSLDGFPVLFGTKTYSPSALAGFDTPFMQFNGAEYNNPQFRDSLGMPQNAQYQLFDNNYYTLISPSVKNYTYTGHLNFEDLSTLQYQPEIKLLVDYSNSVATFGFIPIGTANGYYVAGLINTYLLEFFDQYLKDKPSAHLNSCTAFSRDSILECGK